MARNAKNAPLERRDYRGPLLAMLVDDEVLKIVKSQLSPEEIALLVLEEINPHRPLKTAQKAQLARVSERAYRDRKIRGEDS